MALGVIEGKEATKNRILCHILCFLRDRYTIFRIFDSIIIHLGLLINRSVSNPKIEAYFSGIDKGASPYRGHGQNTAVYVP